MERITLTNLKVWLSKIFETTNIPMHKKNTSIQWLCENAIGIMLNTGKNMQCTRHKLALEIPKISKTDVDLLFNFFYFWLMQFCCKYKIYFQ
jgi:hypothetical protein